MKAPKFCKDCPFVYKHAPMTMVDHKGLIRTNLRKVLMFFNMKTKEDVAKFTWGCHKKHPEVSMREQANFHDCAGMIEFQKQIANDPRELIDITEIRIMSEHDNISI